MTKINITLCVGNWVLNIFHLTIFSKKKTIFSKMTAKNNFFRHDHFSGNGSRWMTKMNITFSVGNGIPNTNLKLFPRKSSYWLNES